MRYVPLVLTFIVLQGSRSYFGRRFLLQQNPQNGFRKFCLYSPGIITGKCFPQVIFFFAIHSVWFYKKRCDFFSTQDWLVISLNFQKNTNFFPFFLAQNLKAFFIKQHWVYRTDWTSISITYHVNTHAFSLLHTINFIVDFFSGQSFYTLSFWKARPKALNREWAKNSCESSFEQAIQTSKLW